MRAELVQGPQHTVHLQRCTCRRQSSSKVCST
eukprot:CAMPEP_0175739150 /NCGR_PEP_ID=MMETSP0097-20121207/54847_1 /TAXON_ID=311494 /ORGANISM="Alexandrium monilatum, Strain CCMP3105" /LENGTH=31 /DNA_ID= /DNA_START= /DNA_END= /DNA_ORIENTATION=